MNNYKLITWYPRF